MDVELTVVLARDDGDVAHRHLASITCRDAVLDRHRLVRRPEMLEGGPIAIHVLLRHAGEPELVVGQDGGRREAEESLELGLTKSGGNDGSDRSVYVTSGSRSTSIPTRSSACVELVAAPYRGTTRWSSSTEIEPASTLARPSVQSEPMPAPVAARSISSCDAPEATSARSASSRMRNWKMPIRPR